MVRLSAAACAAVVLMAAAGTQAEPLQAPFASPAAPTVAGSTPAGKAYSSFIEHFSAPQQGGSPYLIEAFRALHPGAGFLATQSRDFDFKAFASNTSANNATLTPITAGKDFALLHTFIPAARRIDGEGTLGADYVFGAFDLTWNDKLFRIYEAKWMEGFNHWTQTHVVAETLDDARRLMLAVSAFTTSVFEAVLVFDGGMWQPDHGLWSSIQKASWADVILDEDLKSAVQHEYVSFFKSEWTYKDFGVPWKRGIMFLGPPGNGKTISLKAIMKNAGVPTLYVKSFRTWEGDELGIRLIFQRARAEAPCLLVLEDLDSLITDQNRSFFLNELDGLEDNDGLLLIGTTNHFDRLDPALTNRPSRFDRKYTFPDPNRAERRQYAVYWQNKLKKNPKIEFPDSLLDDVAKETHGFSFAYLKEGFVAALIKLASDESKDPKPFAVVLMEQLEWLKGQLGDKPDDDVDDVIRSALRYDIEGIISSGPAPRPRREIDIVVDGPNTVPRDRSPRVCPPRKIAVGAIPGRARRAI